MAIDDGDTNRYQMNMDEGWRLYKEALKEEKRGNLDNMEALFDQAFDYAKAAEFTLSKFEDASAKLVKNLNREVADLFHKIDGKS